MSLLGILHTGRSGLLAAQVGIQVSSQNVTNAGVEGYSARSVVLGAAAPALLGGRGVEVNGIIRSSDLLLQRMLLIDQGDAASAEARSEILSPVATSMGELESGGLGAALDELWSSFRLLEAQPADLAAREQVLTSVEGVASAFHDLDAMIERERLYADEHVRSNAARLDELAARIAELNEEVAVARADGGGLELMDQRDAMIDEVAKLIDTKVLENADGTVTVIVASGMPLVDGVTATRVRVDPGSAPGHASLQMGQDTLWTDVNDRIAGGSLAGFLTARDADLGRIEERVDQLAYDLVAGLNAQHMLGVGLDGVGGRALLTPLAGVDGAAALIGLDAAMAHAPEAVAAASVAGLSGDNRNATALASLRSATLASGGTSTATDECAAIIGMAAAADRQARDAVATRDAAKAQTEALWEQRVGVSTDEEMVDLIAFEKAYQAASKLVSLVDEMYDTLLAIK